ncbi:hypothetical protein RsTz2092_13550 [Deferribacterales bacterium RsTz2092]|nr:hypothetical protein AGMMS49941_12650 [Deferribacterales bacterium]
MFGSVKLRHCRLSSSQIKSLLNFFISGATARTATELSGVNRDTAIKFYDKLRQIIC